ncbi:MAG: hypothetical protein IH605_19835 [Burkholderiales bacterium]|nr:hypothetical protein [Burkholderiales bacterium]
METYLLWLAAGFALVIAKLVPGNMGDMATMITTAMTMLERAKTTPAKPA